MAKLVTETVENPLRAEIHLLADAFLRKPVPHGMDQEGFMYLWRAWYSHWNPFVHEHDALELLQVLARSNWQVDLRSHGREWRCAASTESQAVEGRGTSVHSAVVDAIWNLVRLLKKEAV
jgi:hypothetical protein